MRELEIYEFEEVSGGFIPIAIGAVVIDPKVVAAASVAVVAGAAAVGAYIGYNETREKE